MGGGATTSIREISAEDTIKQDLKQASNMIEFNKQLHMVLSGIVDAAYGHFGDFVCDSSGTEA